MLVRAFLQERSDNDARRQHERQAVAAEARKLAFVEAEQSVAELRSRAVEELSRANSLRVKAERIRRATAAELKLAKQALTDAEKRAARTVKDAEKQARAIVADAERDAKRHLRQSRVEAKAEARALVKTARQGPKDRLARRRSAADRVAGPSAE